MQYEYSFDCDLAEYERLEKIEDKDIEYVDKTIEYFSDRDCDSEERTCLGIIMILNLLMKFAWGSK